MGNFRNDVFDIVRHSEQHSEISHTPAQFSPACVIPLSSVPLAISHLVALQVIISISDIDVGISQCLCSTNPYFS